MSLPDWMRPIVSAADHEPEHFSPFAPPADASVRPSAVLLLFGETDERPDILLTERATTLRSHAGQVSFPGGAIDPDDDGPVGTAVREGAEETGLDPSGVDVLSTLPTLWIPVSNFAVTPVLAWWRRPSPVNVVDPGEVASVHRVPLEQLLDPANRFQVRHPSGTTGPAFRAGSLLVWGFTALVLSRLFEVAGMERPWDRSRVEALPGPASVPAAGPEGSMNR